MLASSSERGTGGAVVQCMTIVVRWGDLTLMTCARPLPAGFTVGDAGCDFAVDPSPLGASRVELVRAGKDGRITLAVPPGARVQTATDGDVREGAGDSHGATTELSLAEG